MVVRRRRLRSGADAAVNSLHRRLSSLSATLGSQAPAQPHRFALTPRLGSLITSFTTPSVHSTPLSLEALVRLRPVKYQHGCAPSRSSSGYPHHLHDALFVRGIVIVVFALATLSNLSASPHHQAPTQLRLFTQQLRTLRLYPRCSSCTPPLCQRPRNLRLPAQSQRLFHLLSLYHLSHLPRAPWRVISFRRFSRAPPERHCAAATNIFDMLLICDS